MAASTGVIWLCAWVRYWTYRRVGTCASVGLNWYLFIYFSKYLLSISTMILSKRS